MKSEALELPPLYLSRRPGSDPRSPARLGRIRARTHQASSANAVVLEPLEDLLLCPVRGPFLFEADPVARLPCLFRLQNLLIMLRQVLLRET